MEYCGFAGRILYVDLTTGSIRKEPLEPELARGFLGGCGIDSRLLYDFLAPGTDPLSPENPIIIGAGLLVGTLAPSAAKISFTAKRANYASATKENKHVVRTGMAGTAKFGFMLKNAGYDHIVITGRAESPVFLKIVNDDVEICGATDLWGKMDTHETTEELVRRYGRCGVYAIGRAGENLVRFAIGLLDGKNSLGKCGGATVLGSKNLKAIVVYGDKGIKVSDSKRFMAAYDKSYKDMTENPAFGDVARYGLNAVGPTAFVAGRDWRSSYGKFWPFTDEIWVANLSCISCLFPCRAYMEIKDGQFAGMRPSTRYFARPSRTHPLPEDCEQLDLGPRLKLEDVLTRLGLDLQHAEHILEFLGTLYEQGKITKEDTDGLMLSPHHYWTPDLSTSIQLLERIANREGDFARCLGEGWYPISEKFGVDPFAEISIGKGTSTIVDARMHNISPTSFPVIVDPQTQHMHFCTYFSGVPLDVIKARCAAIGMSKEEINGAFIPEGLNTGRVAKHVEDFHNVLNSLGVCSITAQLHGSYDLKLLAEYYSAATGFEVSPEELKRLGEKICNLQRLLNAREGFSRKDDVVPLWWKATEIPYPDGTGTPRMLSDYSGRVVTGDGLEKMLDDYYNERGWGTHNGIPTKEKLIELGLEDLAQVPLP